MEPQGQVDHLQGPDPRTLIGDDDFAQVQDLLSSRARSRIVHKPHRTRHAYIFKSLIYCAICQRRMQGQRSHGDAYYRCRFPQEYALANKLENPRNVYLREAALIDPLDRWLLRTFSPAHRNHTIAHLAEQATTEPPAIPIPQIDTSILAGYNANLDRYRAALEAGADPAVVAGWIKTQPNASEPSTSSPTTRRAYRAPTPDT